MQIQEVLTYEANFNPVQHNHLTLSVNEERFVGGIHKFWQPWDGQIYLNTSEYGWQAFITVEGGSEDEIDVAALQGVSFGTYQLQTHSFVNSQPVKISGNTDEKAPKKRINLGRKNKATDTTTTTEEVKKETKELQTAKATTATIKTIADDKKFGEGVSKVATQVKNTKV